MALQLEEKIEIGIDANYWTIGRVFIAPTENTDRVKVVVGLYLYLSKEAYDNGAKRVQNVEKVFEFEATKSDTFSWDDLYTIAKEKLEEFQEAEDLL